MTRYDMQAGIRWGSILGLGLALLQAPQALAQKGIPPTSVIVGGQPMVSDHDLMDNLSHSADHTVFADLLQLAGMTDALRSHGPFTVFAPTNAAFANMAPGVLDSLRRPDNKSKLVALLSMEIMEGNYSTARLRLLLRMGKGQADLDTVSEGKLKLFMNGPQNLAIRGPKGDVAAIILYDVKQANGVLYVTDRVLDPG